MIVSTTIQIYLVIASARYASKNGEKKEEESKNSTKEEPKTNL